ncbi:MAG: hypothetical protein CVU48_07735 [Candidatus Cloacimonetes bacterium HGW-Cloacimonetes-1]|jgi:hypothetical protein|nr:MAG: hypothetical protein CVU48_07735 [Candidatus Cloacimonetes bacterium HGW-Cloacimonetes-1]
MKKPKFFLTLVLILLIINTIFYLLWYAFDLQGYVRGIVEREGGKALNGRLTIEGFSISDRQIFAQNIKFSDNQKKLSFEVRSLRIRYNLLKIILSGFKVTRGISTIDINNPVVSYKLANQPKKQKSPPLKIPDISHYFEKLTVNNGSFDFRGLIQVSKDPSDILEIREGLKNINLVAANTKVTTVTVRSNTGGNGNFKASFVLDKGNITSAEGDLSDYSPQYIGHSRLAYKSVQISAHVAMLQRSKTAPMILDYSVFVWNLKAQYDKYDLKIPYMGISGTQDRISLDLANSSLDASSLEGSVYITDLQKVPQIAAFLNLKSMYPQIVDKRLSGFLSGEVKASGNLFNPTVTANLRSQEISYLKYALTDLKIEAAYFDQQVTFSIPSANWENQAFNTSGTFSLSTSQLTGILNCSPIESNQSLLQIDSELAYDVFFCPGYPNVRIDVKHLSVSDKALSSGNIIGSITLLPSVLESSHPSYLAGLELQSDQGWKIDGVGDILNRSAALSLDLNSLNITKLFSDKLVKQYDPYISGKLDLIYDNDSLTGRSDLVLESTKEFFLLLNLNSIFNYGLLSKSGSISLFSSKSQLNDAPFELGVNATIADNILSVSKMYFNDSVQLRGSMDTHNFKDFSFDVALSNINTSMIDSYIGFLNLNIPQFDKIDLNAKYNLNGNNEIEAVAKLSNLRLDPLQPLSAALQVTGTNKLLELSGDINVPNQNLMHILGTASILPKLNLSISAITDSIQVPDFLNFTDLSGFLKGQSVFTGKDIFNPKRQMTLKAMYVGTKLVYQDTVIDTLDIDIEQTNQLLVINKLSAQSNGLLSLNASGALGYNALTSTFYDSNHKLNISLDVALFNWAERQFGIIQEAKGTSSIECSIGVFEEQFIVSKGKLLITNGSLKIAKQMEEVTNITFDAEITDNKVQINQANCSIGQGKLYIENYFEQDFGDHFTIGFLDLGIFRIRSDNSGFLINIPLYTPPRNLTKIIIRGRDSRFAIVKGPFDDMKIVADLIASSSNLLYPSDTDNLLKLINTVRTATTQKKNEDPAPLPFKLDVMLILQDNVRYVTYPANIEINPNSFLHLVYDGQLWKVPEAYFGSEKGTIDFLGSVFSVDYIGVNIIESQNLISVDGTFYKRAADGSIITLTVSTNRDNTKDFFNRLEFNLSSDNPEDRTISHIISRLRYNQSYEELSPGQRQDLLQDEALNLISSNLNTSFITPFLYPIENRVRQFLHLDSFTINVGFIQNLFTQYTSNSSRFSDYTDFKQIDSDIMQFSSSILLNNFSVYTSKYLGRKVFLDYRFGLQEATDLANNTKLLITHDTSLRLNLPYHFKIAYTFSFEPVEDQITHEWMLQRSFRF